MPDLYIFDKDQTLIEPVSQQVFVQHPQDQRLKNGVSEKLKALQVGSIFAIASNQGGCAINKIYASKLRAGMFLHRDGLVREISAVNPSNVVDIAIIVQLADGDVYPYLTHQSVNVSYKSIDDAVEEMRFAMKLTGIHFAMMAHDYEERGGEAYAIDQEFCRLIQSGSLQQLYRKPSPGMLNYLDQSIAQRFIVSFQRKIFVGDRPEDKAAAAAAGFEFEWADTFFEAETD